MSKDIKFGIKKDELESNIAIGIDLGTTNSCVSIIREGIFPEIIPIEGRDTIPSCVTWLGGDKFIVGKESYEQRYKENSIYSVKRLMGSDKKVKLIYKGEELILTPEEVSAKILRKIVDEVNKDYGNIKKVVVTVPANFNMEQIKATKEACRIAGLDLLKLLKEPTSAAILNTVTNDVVNKNILVYDLGGGTFDVSLVSVRKSEGVTKELKDFLAIYGIKKDISNKKNSAVEVKYTDGDMELGGDNLDRILAEKVLENVNININDLTRENRERFILKIENLKKSINNSNMLNFEFEFEFTNGNSMKEKIKVNYNLFKEATRVIFDKTRAIIDLALKENRNIKIDTIALVGGSTKNEALKELLRETYPTMVISDGLQPDESVALGAGVVAKEMTCSDLDMKIFDVIQSPIGILRDGIIESLLPKDTVIPSSIRKSYYTTNKDSNLLSLRLYEGTSTIPSDCRLIGDLNIPYENKDKTIKKVIVNIRVTINGLIEVTTDIDGKETKVDITEPPKSDENEIPKKFRKWRDLIFTINDNNLVNKAMKLWEKSLNGDRVAEKELGKIIKTNAKLYKPQTVDSSKKE